MLNRTIPDCCYVTFKVINAKVGRAGFGIGYLPIMENTDKFNSYFIVPCTLEDKHVTKQDAAYSCHSQTMGEFQPQFNLH